MFSYRSFDLGHYTLFAFIHPDQLAEFSSGSALYHWLRDDHILQGRTHGEELRAKDQEDANSTMPVLRKVYFRVLCNFEVTKDQNYCVKN